MLDRALRSGEKIFKMKYKRTGNSKSMLLYKRTVEKDRHLSTGTLEVEGGGGEE